MAVTPTALKTAQKQYAAASVAIEATRVKRNKLIVKASAQGMRDVDIARATGLGKSRIGQILENERSVIA